MKRKIWFGIFIVTIVVLAIVLIVTQTKREPEAIKIGAILPLTGDGAIVGESAQKGINLALEEVNSKRQKNIKVVFEDSQQLPTIGVTAFKKLITVDKVRVVIGGLASSVTLACAPIAEENHVVLISPASSAPKIRDAGDFVFRSCASDVLEGRKMAKFAFERLGYKELAILYINNDYGLGLKDALWNTFSELGGLIPIIETFDQGTKDFRTQLLKIKAKNISIIYLVGYPAELGLILNQSKELGLKAQFISSVVFENSQVVDVAGKNADGVIYTARGYDADKEDPIVQRFVNAFREKYDAKPDIYAALGYDTMRIVALAISKAGDESSKLKNELYTIKNFLGVTGKITFDEKGDVIKPITIKTFKDGKFRYYAEKNQN